jgi:hypothetical protein
VPLSSDQIVSTALRADATLRGVGLVIRVRF